MPNRKLGNSDLEVAAVGFGCMGLNFGYGRPLSKGDAIKLIRDAADRGVTSSTPPRSMVLSPMRRSSGRLLRRSAIRW
jgi:hypothetical protein